MEPVVVADYECECGEGPLWHEAEQRLYWLDIPRGRIFRYDPATGAHEQCFQGGVVGGFTVQADGALLLFMEEGAVRIWREGELTTVIDQIAEERDSRFNDVIADPEGRVFCGTMSSKAHPGRLYRLDTDGTLTKLLNEVGTSNGMGFTRDLQQMYFTDSRARDIYLFDYDRDTGAISSRRLFVHREGEGGPDGMTVDAEGHVWSAQWGASCLIRYTPDGTEERRTFFPARRVSSVTFGGADYTDIYVTSAGGSNKPQEGPGAGALFRLNPGIRGVAEFTSRVGC